MIEIEWYWGWLLSFCLVAVGYLACETVHRVHSRMVWKNLQKRQEDIDKQQLELLSYGEEDVEDEIALYNEQRGNPVLGRKVMYMQNVLDGANLKREFDEVNGDRDK